MQSHLNMQKMITAPTIKPVIALPVIILSMFMSTCMDVLKRNCVVGFGADMNQSPLLALVVFSVLAVGCMFIHPSFDYNV